MSTFATVATACDGMDKRFRFTPHQREARTPRRCDGIPGGFHARSRAGIMRACVTLKFCRRAVAVDAVSYEKKRSERASYAVACRRYRHSGRNPL
jgi:hypothetical protein